jgi:ADP-ribose pyrophosphatase
LEEVARIELAEETGLRAGSLELLGEFYAAYGFSSQPYSIFLATELTQGEASPEPEEHGIVARAVTGAGVEARLQSGENADRPTAAAYGLLRSRGLPDL